MPADDVQLPDLEVIQRFSLAVRGATAPRAEVIEALQADLAWLTGDGGAPAGAQAATPGAEAPSAAPRKRAARRTVPPTPRKPRAPRTVRSPAEAAVTDDPAARADEA